MNKRIIISSVLIILITISIVEFILLSKANKDIGLLEDGLRFYESYYQSKRSHLLDNFVGTQDQQPISVLNYSLLSYSPDPNMYKLQKFFKLNTSFFSEGNYYINIGCTNIEVKTLESIYLPEDNSEIYPIIFNVSRERLSSNNFSEKCTLQVGTYFVDFMIDKNIQ